MTGCDAPSNNCNKIALDPELTFSKKSTIRSWAWVCLLGVAILFLISTAVFIGLFVHYYLKDTESDSSQTTNCITPACITTAAMMIRKMNTSADPCVDFDEYACGRFNREMVLPDGKTYVGVSTVLSDDNQLVMKGIVTEEMKPGDPEYLNNMKRLYKSCMNEAQIEQVGLDPYLKNTAFVSDWPTMNPAWDSNKFNLSDTITRYAKESIFPLISFAVTTDFKNTSIHVIYLIDPSLGLSQEYLSRPRNNSVIMAYQTYLTESAIALGAQRSAAEQGAKDVLDIETALSKILVPQAERRDYHKQYNPVTLGQLSTMYPELDIPRAVRAVFEMGNITLPDHQRLINQYPTFLDNLTSVVGNFSARVVQNLFGFKYALSRVAGLTKRMREIQLNFEKVSSGKMEESPRWKDCIGKVSNVFPNGMSKQYVTRTFSEHAKIYMEKMIDNLMAVFKQMLEQSTWMGRDTKEAAYKKLAALGRKIGYPNKDFQEADIEKKYKNHIMDETDFYKNHDLNRKLSIIEALQRLQKPVDKNEWRKAPFEVNAYYSPLDNEIAFLAGVLQMPYFSETFPDSVNYGAIGAVIGHEITHGFDDVGRQFDADGNVKNWWQPADNENFVKRKQCIVDQYSSFHLEEINMTLNGIITQGENVADNGGVKESFRAYKEFVRKTGNPGPTLPGLGLTQDQLFFLAFSQLWCGKMTREQLIYWVTRHAHPPGKFRIIGALQNSEDFAKAYNCPPGSYMNPVTKCSVW